MKNKNYNKNIRIFLVSGWIQGFKALWAPILILFMLENIGLTLTQIFIIEAVYAGTVLALEIPSGIFADLFGRKKTILMGISFFIIGMVIFSFATNVTTALIGNIFVAFAASFLSGAKDALLYDSLKQNNQEHEYKKILAKIETRRFITQMIASFIGGIIAARYGLQLPVILTTVCICVLGILYSFLNEVPVENNDMLTQKITFKYHAIESFQSIAQSKYIIWLCVFTMALGLVDKLSFFTLNPYWQLKDVPIIWYGYALATYNAIAAITSKNAHWFIEKYGNKSTQWTLVCIGIGGFALLTLSGITPFLAVLIPAIFQINRSLKSIFINDILHTHTKSHQRATVISMQSFLVQGTQFLYLPIFGYLSDSIGLLDTLFITSIILMIILVPASIMMTRTQTTGPYAITHHDNSR